MASRKQKQLEIQPLPKRLYKQVYGNKYKGGGKNAWTLRYSGLSDDEKRAVTALLSQHNFKSIYWVPEVDFPEKIKTPDLLIEGKLVEIKKVSSERSIRERIHDLSKQIGNDGWAILDITNSKLEPENALELIERRCAMDGIQRFAVTDNNKLTAFKEVNTKKEIKLPPPLPGHDSRSPYVDILPDISKKSTTTDSDKISAIGNFKPRKRTNAYWQKRSEQRLTESEQTSESYAKQVRKVYQEAQRQTVLEVRKMYEAYYKKDEGFDMVASHATATGREVVAIRQLLDALEAINGRSRLGVRHVEEPVQPDSAAATHSVLFVCNGGAWQDGRWLRSPKAGPGVAVDTAGRVVAGIWEADTLVSGSRTDCGGEYVGQFDRRMRASGHGHYAMHSGAYYEGRWRDDLRWGFGFAVDSSRLRAGEWLAGAYRGERLSYTSERIYGIDISRYQHGRGRRYYPIHWRQLRITDLGRLSKKDISGQVDYPVSFVYIKSTEGSTIRNRFYRADYLQARRNGIRCGAYHFFSVRSTARAQARHFLRNSYFRSGDLPPVLDVEPTDRQIAQIGGIDELFRRVRTWMNIVRRRTGVRPILYVNQRFVNKYLGLAPDIKQNYNVWIARYGEYKPDIKLVFWQLSPDGRVSGIHGDVDINVFNGYQEQFDRFLETELIK